MSLRNNRRPPARPRAFFLSRFLRNIQCLFFALNSGLYHIPDEMVWDGNRSETKDNWDHFVGGRDVQFLPALILRPEVDQDRKEINRLEEKLRTGFCRGLNAAGKIDSVLVFSNFRFSPLYLAFEIRLTSHQKLFRFQGQFNKSCYWQPWNLLEDVDFWF